jgi:cobalt-zinc-cadmium efflux system protein
VHTHGHEQARRPGEGLRVLAVVLALTLGYGIVEAIGGWLTGSLALLADAAHMGSDASSLALALLAAWLAARPPTPRRSFGFARAEILAALVNGLALVALGIWILVEALGRLDAPTDVDAGPMLAVAVVGLGVNAGALWLLARRGGDALNVRAALWHVVADLAASAGTIAAALVLLATGWEQADPLVAGLVGLLVVGSAWGVLRESVSVLLEASPRGVDPVEVGAEMAAFPGVVEVHDLHIWEITSGFPALSAHVLVEPGGDCHGVRRALGELLRARFAIEHTTLQVDHAAANGLVALGEVERRDVPLDGT